MNWCDVSGPPGVGKTVAVRHVLKELEEKTDDIIPIYINTWQKNTTYKIVIELCNQLNYKFTHNKKTEELFNIVKKDINKKSVVICFDEIDKVEDLDFLYMLLEQIYRKTIIMITNYKSWALEMDERIKSRLALEFLEFKKYNPNEISGILRERLKYAFVSNVWQLDSFNLAAKKTAAKSAATDAKAAKAPADKAPAAKKPAAQKAEPAAAECGGDGLGQQLHQCGRPGLWPGAGNHLGAQPQPAGVGQLRLSEHRDHPRLLLL